MTLSSSFLLPTHRLYVALAFCLACAAAALTLAVRTPWLGVELSADDDGAVRVLSAVGPAAGIPADARLVSVEAAGRVVVPTAGDLIEEPDLLDDYAQMDAFFERQAALAALLAQPVVTLGWQGAQGGEIQTMRVEPARRPLASLPLAFWFQLAVSSAGCLIAAWVWALRPGEWGVRMFAITGASFPLFAMPAAVYSGRELALDAGVFRALGGLNHWAAMMFGAALIGVFLCSPRPLARPRWLLVPFVGYGLWWIGEWLRLAPDLDWGSRYLVMSEMLVALTLAGVQWARSRGEPVDRAALRWFMLSLLLGSGLFILLIVATASLGLLPPMPQGFAFGFFLFIYIGIALGLGRYRLFELDVWAYRLFGWLGAAVAVVALDALFVAAFDWSAPQALAASIWAGTLAYLPFRRSLWRSLTTKHGQQMQDLLPDVVRIAFEPVPRARERRWDELLERLFRPLEMRPAGEAPPSGADGRAQVLEDGLTLFVPACARIGPRRLRYPGHGARLFGPRDRIFVEALGDLMSQAEASRAAQERAAAEERQRIARDVHDDVGARLLMLIHHAANTTGAELARAAMQDLRTALGSLDAHPVPLDHALADWRSEAGDRCEAASVALDWAAPPAGSGRWLSPRQKTVLERCLRETITNALRHGGPTRLLVHIWLNGDVVALQVSHDGPVTSPDAWVRGRGLRGMAQRLQAAGGMLQSRALEGGGTQTTIQLPLDQDDSHA